MPYNPDAQCLPKLRGGGSELAAAWLKAPRPAQGAVRPPSKRGRRPYPRVRIGPQEAVVSNCLRRPQQPDSRPVLAPAHARILRLRELKKLAQGHTASKRLTRPGLRTHLARSPPHTARPAAAAETAAQCAGASSAGCAGRRRGRQPAGRRTKPPFFPRAPPSASSSALAAPAGGSAQSRDPLPSLRGFRETAARAKTSEVGQGSADESPGLAAGGGKKGWGGSVGGRCGDRRRVRTPEGLLIG